MGRLLAALCAALVVTPALAAPPPIPPSAPFPAPYARSTLSSGNILPSLVTNPVTSGLVAEYPMTEGSGTVVRDISGNGNTANFGTNTNAPSWGTYGVAFNTTLAAKLAQFVQTPVKAWKTAVIHVCVAPFPPSSGITAGGPFYGQFPSVLGPVNNSDGIILLFTTSTNSKYNGPVTPGIYRDTGATFVTTTAGPLVGACGVLVYTLDTLDHVYWYPVGDNNGGEISYATQGASSSYVTTSGTGYQIGNGTSSAFNALAGTIGYVELYSNVLTATQAQQEAAFINYQVSKRPGFPVSTRSNYSGDTTVVLDGDSLTSGYRGSVAWGSATYITPTNNTYNFVNYGISSGTPQTEVALGPLRHLQAIPVQGKAYCFEWTGTNSLGDSNFTAAQTWGSLSTLASIDRQNGCIPIVVTMIARPSLAASKNSFNGLIRIGWRSVGFAALLDLAAIPVIGADSAYTNTACFYTDQVHLIGPGAGSCLNSLTGYGLVASYYARMLNILDGSTIDNPTVTTSNAYTEADADNFVLQTPTGAATAVLPDCTGLTSIQRTITNGSGTFTITVSGAGSSSTIVGLATVLAGTTGTFTCQLVSASAGGNQWARTQ